VWPPEKIHLTPSVPLSTLVERGIKGERFCRFYFSCNLKERYSVKRYKT
jgi:hypothetical protein